MDQEKLDIFKEWLDAYKQRARLEFQRVIMGPQYDESAWILAAVLKRPRYVIDMNATRKSLWLALGYKE